MYTLPRRPAANRRRGSVALLLLLLALGSVTACGSSGSSADASEAARSDESDASDGAGRSDRSEASDRSEQSDRSDRSVFTDPSDFDNATDVADLDTGVGPATGQGTTFVDPQGSYGMQIGSDWTEQNGIQGIQDWLVASPTQGFGPNVNVVVQPTPPGLSMKEFLDESFEGAGAVLNDFQLIDTAVIKVDGRPVGLAEYSAQEGGRNLDFLVSIAMGAEHTAICTFTAGTDQFDALVPAVQPFQETLQAN